MAAAFAAFESSDFDELTVLAAPRVSKTSRLGAHAIAAVFVILLAAFSMFCRYYPWKLPTMPVGRIAKQLQRILASVCRVEDKTGSLPDER